MMNLLCKDRRGWNNQVVVEKLQKELEKVKDVEITAGQASAIDPQLPQSALQQLTDRKPYQSALIRSFGIDIPDTLIMTDRDTALDSPCSPWPPCDTYSVLNPSRRTVSATGKMSGEKKEGEEIIARRARRSRRS